MKKKLLLTLLAVIGGWHFGAYSQAGFTCSEAIQVNSLPYVTTDNTSNYGDTYDVQQPVGCATSSGNYMGGNDVFYSYTPLSDEIVTITMTPQAGWSGIFVYDGCTNLGVACVAGVANGSSTVRQIQGLSLQTGHNYIITISTFPTPQTVAYTLQIQNSTVCPTPSQIVASNISTTAFDVSWFDGTTNNTWEVYIAPCNAPAPTPNTVGNPVTVQSYSTSNLLPNTCYKVYIRSVCSTNEYSQWSAGLSVTTTGEVVPPPVCGGQFIDNGGSANYLNSSNVTYTICPTNPGEIVTVTFTSFNTETNFDGLYVYDGNSTASTQISSSNPSGNVPGGLPGSFWGTTIPGPFTSSDPSGCLTFLFLSDSSVNRPGWVADVTCEPAPTCPKPTSVSVVANSFTSATLNWNENGSATQWEVLVTSSSNTTGTSYTTGNNPFEVPDLIAGEAYTISVRAICSTSDLSNWSTTTLTITPCEVPANVNAIVISSNSAQINWNNTNSLNSWEVLVVPSGSAAPDSTTSGTATNLASYTAVGLSANSSYDVYVRSACLFNSFSDWSTVVSFSTPEPEAFLVGNTTLYNAEQLVSNVLINNPCITISNVTSSTGTNFGTSNGIGYFTNSNSNFPLESGIVLSTGDAQSITGPNTNTLGQGGSNWTGDPELEAIITNATGNVMYSYNATKLEFDFTSLNEFMSFNFLFASEEYGVFQCQYSDAFAFLLTDLVNGTTTNIAVVPGTTTPVSVVTIRDGANNTGCSSQNPDFFGSFNEGANALSSASNFNGQTVLMTASSAIIPNHPYHIKLVVADRGDSLFDSAVFIQAGSFTSGPPECNERVQLVAFVDENNNGVKDSGENNFTYGSFGVEENNSGTVTNVTSPFGSYTIYDSTATTYDFTYAIDSEYSSYYSASGVSYNDINIALNTDPILYFPITLIQGYNDVTVTITPIVPPRPGFNYVNKVVYKNLGVTATSGTVSYNNDPSTTIVSVSQAGTVSTPTGFTYDFANLQPSESRSLNVTMSVPAIPTVNIDDILTTTASVSAPANDINLNNNLFTNAEVVVAAYDPNDISEAHGGKIQYDQFSANDYLYYTVRFQNMGTASAINVRIENELNAQLDENSIRMVSASHNYIMERVGNQLTWRFDYINLVSHLQNEDLSKGYVTYKIRVKPGFAVGDIIPNAAGIYFDTNPVVITNTFNTEFVTTLGTGDFGSSNMIVFPNPANSTIQISLQNTSETIASVTITDVLGKNIRTLKATTGNQMSVDVADLSQGVYFVEITTGNNLKQVKKLVKE